MRRSSGLTNEKLRALRRAGREVFASSPSCCAPLSRRHKPPVRLRRPVSLPDVILAVEAWKGWSRPYIPSFLSCSSFLRVKKREMLRFSFSLGGGVGGRRRLGASLALVVDGKLRAVRSAGGERLFSASLCDFSPPQKLPERLRCFLRLLLEDFVSSEPPFKKTSRASNMASFFFLSSFFCSLRLGRRSRFSSSSGLSGSANRNVRLDVDVGISCSSFEPATPEVTLDGIVETCSRSSSSANRIVRLDVAVGIWRSWCCASGIGGAGLVG